MQKLYFKKEIDLEGKLKEIISISVNESIDYRVEKNGMRAIGNIIITGEYRDDYENKDFIDSIELDVFAMFNKIIDKNDFVLKVENFQYKEVKGNINMDIEVCVYGVKDEKQRVVDVEENKEVISDQEDNDLGIYYYYVVETGDSYESIARKYNKEINIIEEYNQYKELELGSIVVIPYSWDLLSMIIIIFNVLVLFKLMLMYIE